MSGHLFITHGDLLALSCDAILIPSGIMGDGSSHIQPHWRSLGIADDHGYVDRGADAAHPVIEVRSGGWPKPAVWLGHVGDVSRTPEDDAAVLDAFVRSIGTIRRESRRLGTQAARPLGDARPLVAVPLVGTGVGGRANVKGEVVTAVVTRLAATTAEVDVDVTLVLRDEGDYAAAQQSRSHVLGAHAWVDLPSQVLAEADRLAREALNGRLVAFVGAGASVGSGLPSWSTMLDELLALVRTTGDASLVPSEEERATLDHRDVGTLIERGLGASEMKEEVVRLIESAGAGQVSLIHQILASMPIHEAITTNYDLLLERAWEGAGREPTVLPRQRHPVGRDWLLKLHGSIDDRERIVLSRGDYLRFDEEAGALAGIVSAMLITRHLLFVGYSLSDENFHQIVHQVRSAQAPYAAGASGEGDTRPIGTVLTPEPPGVVQRIWEPDMRFVSTASGPDWGIREQAIFLDRLAAQSSPPGKHLLDPSYAAVFSSDELEVRRLVELLRQSADAERVRPALRRAIDQALAAFGEDDQE